MSTSVAKRVGIAVVEQAGHYLIGTRGPDVPLAGYAEFPGGKCWEGEAAEVCAVRECLEETGIAVRVERLLLRCEQAYPHATVDLHFWLCHPTAGISLTDEACGFRWVPAQELAALHFPNANAAVVKLISG